MRLLFQYQKICPPVTDNVTHLGQIIVTKQLPWLKYINIYITTTASLYMLYKAVRH